MSVWWFWHIPPIDLVSRALQSLGDSLRDSDALLNLYHRCLRTCIESPFPCVHVGYPCLPGRDIALECSGMECAVLNGFFSTSAAL